MSFVIDGRVEFHVVQRVVDAVSRARFAPRTTRRGSIGLLLLRAFVIAASLVASNAIAARAALCNVPTGGRIVLESDAVDPDVFLWDSRSRLVDYAAGEWGNTRAIFAHTVLAEPGTQATVVSCIPGVAHPKFASGDEDAIGVKIVSGPYKGRYGWVLSSDIHFKNGAAAGGTLVGTPKEFKR